MRGGVWHLQGWALCYGWDQDLEFQCLNHLRQVNF
jgi:hypothetical protein